MCPFATKDTLGQFVSQKFNLWSKRTNKFATHNTKQYHQVALARMDALKSGMIHPESTIENHVRLISESNDARNRYIIKCMAEALLFCGKNALLFEAIEMIVVLILNQIKATF